MSHFPGFHDPGQDFVNNNPDQTSTASLSPTFNAFHAGSSPSLPLPPSNFPAAHSHLHTLVDVPTPPWYSGHISGSPQANPNNHLHDDHRPSRRGRPNSHFIPQFCNVNGCKSTKVFTKQGQFDKHARVHSKPVKCPFQPSGCPSDGFPQNKGLHRHLWSHHRLYAAANNIPRVDKDCPVCGMTQRADNLNRHMKIHQ